MKVVISLALTGEILYARDHVALEELCVCGNSDNIFALRSAQMLTLRGSYSMIIGFSRITTS